MEDLFSHADPSSSSASASSDVFGSGSASPASCGERTLPTDRASLQRQWALVEAAAVRSGIERRTVASADLAREEGVTTETATQTLRFCSQFGRLFTGGRGKFVVTDAGWEITQRWQEDETHAQLQLQAQLLQHWSVPKAWEALCEGPRPVDELAKILQAGLPGKPRRGCIWWSGWRCHCWYTATGKASCGRPPP